MSVRSVARQYVNALFDVAQRSGQVARVGREVMEFAALAASHEELVRVFRSPTVPPDRKRAIVQALVDAAGLSPEVQRLLVMLAERDRLTLLDGIAAGFSKREMEAGHVVRAELTSAAPLEDKARDGLVAGLGKAVDRRIVVTERVDPAIIGGVVARVGSVVFDGSVARHLERLREKLLADAS